MTGREPALPKSWEREVVPVRQALRRGLHRKRQARPRGDLIALFRAMPRPHGSTVAAQRTGARGARRCHRRVGHSGLPAAVRTLPPSRAPRLVRRVLPASGDRARPAHPKPRRRRFLAGEAEQLAGPRIRAPRIVTLVREGLNRDTNREAVPGWCRTGRNIAAARPTKVGSARHAVCRRGAFTESEAFRATIAAACMRRAESGAAVVPTVRRSKETHRPSMLRPLLTGRAGGSKRPAEACILRDNRHRPTADRRLHTAGRHRLTADRHHRPLRREAHHPLVVQAVVATAAANARPPAAETPVNPRGQAVDIRGRGRGDST
jgi:hypothetical protein